MYYDDYYRRDWYYYPRYYDRRRYYDDYYYRPYRNLIYDSQFSNVNQSIYNSGWMNDVYQNSYVNQIMAPRRRNRR